MAHAPGPEAWRKLESLPTDILTFAIVRLDSAGRYRGHPALPIARELDRRYPRDPGVKLSLAKCLSASGHGEAAVELLRKVLNERLEKSILYPADDPATVRRWIGDELDRLTEPERQRRAEQRRLVAERVAGRRREERRRAEEEEAERQAEVEAARRAEAESAMKRIAAQAESSLEEAAQGKGRLRDVFHTTHITNLGRILERGALLSFRHAKPVMDLGDAGIKEARLSRSVPGSDGKVVADFIPFYFTPLSPMMYRLIRELEDAGESKSSLVIFAAQAERILSTAVPCFVTSGNARAKATRFEIASVHTLASVPNWDAIQASSWLGNDEVRAGRQAELLVPDEVTLDFVDRLAVCDRDSQRRVRDALGKVGVNLRIEVRPDWFF